MADMASSLAALLQVPGMQELFNQAITTQRQQAPLRTALTQQATNMLPGAAFAGQNGGVPNIASIAPANYTTPAPTTSTLATILKALALGGGGLAAANAASGGNLGSALANGLKKLFGGGGGGPSGGGGTATSPTLDQFLSQFSGWQPNGTQYGTSNLDPSQLPGYSPPPSMGDLTPVASGGGDLNQAPGSDWSGDY